jgi:hypothetical protein
MGVSFAENSEYEMRFDYFTGKGVLEEHAAGRLQPGMLLMQVDSQNLKGVPFSNVKNFLRNRCFQH